MTPDHPASVAPAGASRILLDGYLAVGFTREWLRAWAAILILLGPARLVLRLAARLLGLRIRINGLEHIDPDERYLVLPLHENFAANSEPKSPISIRHLVVLYPQGDCSVILPKLLATSKIGTL